jgi:hypothetical protein
MIANAEKLDVHGENPMTRFMTIEPMAPISMVARPPMRSLKRPLTSCPVP